MMLYWDGTWHSREFNCKARTTLSDCHGPISAGDDTRRQILHFFPPSDHTFNLNRRPFSPAVVRTWGAWPTDGDVDILR
ncbi:hypothetical protein L1987_39078 [Smallanthus sonchifolius]|uniref:Uncharacterized protein n=1 Tax=Smallanthus sonchifolius TaxID=185202 RepID=A0ACB9HLW0_9ASTR|nr:hypothetical protein L1987_39078 [Smallanthus sonchifolius]